MKILESIVPIYGNSNKLREIKNTATYLPKSHSLNRKNEVTMYRLRISHSKISHNHLI